MIKNIIDILKDGGVVGMPTETVYGLAASIESTKGIDSIFSTKERPFFDPLIVHVCSIEQAKKYTKNWNELADKIAKHLWPGPVTLILEKNNLVSDKITSGLDYVGLRMPNHPLALELIESLGHPVAAPSANKFKKTSPTTAQHVQEEFPSIEVIDGGKCTIGIESTVLGIFDDKILIYRPGMITINEIKEIIKDEKIEIRHEQSPVAPGQLKHHYMPNTPVILTLKDQALEIEDSSLLTNPGLYTLPLNAFEGAREIYSIFRDYDKKKYSSIIVEVTKNQLLSEEFLGIMNRLEKAAMINLAKNKS